MDETVFLASLTASPVIFPYAYVFGGSYSILASIFACLFTFPCCAFMSVSLRGKGISRMTRYTLLIPLCIPLAYTLCPCRQRNNSFGWDFSSLLLIMFATLLGVRSMLSVSKAPLKIPAVCVSTRRRVAHTVSSQLLIFLYPSVFISRASSLMALLLGAALLTLPLSRNLASLSVLNLAKDLVYITISMNVFYDTCLATTRLYSTLPPLRLNGKNICQDLALGKRVSWWESSLFVCSGRASREWVWAISPIGGRVLNWRAMVDPALAYLRAAAHQLEQGSSMGGHLQRLAGTAVRSYSQHATGSSHLGGGDNAQFRLTSRRKPQVVQLEDLEQVLWSLDTLGTLVHHAYTENKNGVTQVHFREITDTLFALEATVTQTGGPPALHDRIHNTLYKICTRYASAVYALDMDQKYLDRFVNYSDFKV
ncbi:hypothetical protein BIW11_11121 [Tropilaelaps mercedesae]|uniref:Uncharacterized protein n=1 Tax=Tropilaelaps mercedesae TaxID=418985 RepID=A0A1V9XCW7_9ACAR|nr:hypothetical protein BIW11_11121 [Tropilaelaps mercedesae]